VTSARKPNRQTQLHVTFNRGSSAQLSSADWSRPPIRGHCVGTPPMSHVTSATQLTTPIDKRCHRSRDHLWLKLRRPALVSPDNSPNPTIGYRGPEVAAIQTDASTVGRGRNGTAVQLRPMGSTVAPNLGLIPPARSGDGTDHRSKFRVQRYRDKVKGILHLATSDWAPSTLNNAIR
jgi:hypothetical protein